MPRLRLKPSFKMIDINKFIERKIKEHEKAILNRLIAIGRAFVKDARDTGSYLNHTFNLRSSIAFAVLKDGVIVHEDFLKVGNGLEGLQAASDLINELSANYRKGYALIVVAGENYAAAVESKGRTVLTASSYEAKNQLRSAFKPKRN